MARRRSWALDYSEKELYDCITKKLDQAMIWKDIALSFNLPANKLSLVWKWYNNRKNKYAYSVLTPTFAQTEPQTKPQLATTTIGGVPSPAPPSIPQSIGGVPPPPLNLNAIAPPPAPPSGKAEVRELTQEELDFQAQINYNTNKSRKLYGSLESKEELQPRSIELLQELQSELKAALAIS